MSTDVALSDQMKKAQVMADSSLLPESYRKQPANLLWAMELADALDVSLAQAITGITVIQGKPTMSAEMMRALVLRAGHRFTVTDMTDQSVTVTVARREWPDDVQQFTFSMADAQHAGLAKSATYQKHPKAMLLARATSMACRAVFPDVVSGMGYTPDEIGHDDPARRVDTSRLTPKTTPKVVAERVETAPEPTENAPETVLIDAETGEILPESDAESAPDVSSDDSFALEIVDEPAKNAPETVTETPLTATQSGLITALIKTLGFGKTEGLAFYSATVGRPITATRDLTRDEADVVIAALQDLRGSDDG